MNNDTSSPACSLHPKEPIIGVCHLCLNERLLILAVEQSQSHHHRRLLSYSQSLPHHKLYYSSQSLKQHKNKPTTKIPFKFFSFGNSVFSRFHSRRLHSPSYSDDDNASSPDQDSFISIKFEDNGVALWDKGNSVSKVSLDHCNISCNNHKTTKIETTTKNIEGKTVIKHPEMPRCGSMRWRKRIGHMFQLIRWKRSPSKGSNGWIRTLTKRRTKP